MAEYHLFMANNALTGASYVIIALIILLRERHVTEGAHVLFTAFILFCGLHHLAHILYGVEDRDHAAMMYQGGAGTWNMAADIPMTLISVVTCVAMLFRKI